jgi:hypothetical protein
LYPKLKQVEHTGSVKTYTDPSKVTDEILLGVMSGEIPPEALANVVPGSDSVEH